MLTLTKSDTQGPLTRVSGKLGGHHLQRRTVEWKSECIGPTDSKYRKCFENRMRGLGECSQRDRSCTKSTWLASTALNSNKAKSYIRLLRAARDLNHVLSPQEQKLLLQVKSSFEFYHTEMTLAEDTETSSRLKNGTTIGALQKLCAQFASTLFPSTQLIFSLARQHTYRLSWEGSICGQQSWPYNPSATADAFYAAAIQEDLQKR